MDLGPPPDHALPTGGIRSLRRLARHLWPAQHPDLKARVVLSLVCLGIAKGATVVVPLLLRDAVDLLSGREGLAVALPIGLIVAYGVARVASTAFGELRDALFVKVGQRAIHDLALQVFRHLHALGLRFHLERRTGGLARAIERGTKGISSLLSYLLYNILPTILEIALVIGILWSLLDGWFALVTLVTVVLYVAFTLLVTEWRNELRRRMNETDQEASGRAIDSLLNYETVKYFGNEAYEAERYDRALTSYERAAVRSESTLSLLNVGQAAIIGAGLTGVLLLAGRGVLAGRLTVGEFVMVNTYLLQLFQPLNFLGWVYRTVKQSFIDMEAMFTLLAVPAEVVDDAEAPALEVNGGAIEFEDVHFAYDPRRPVLKGVSFRVPAGKTVAIVGASGGGKSTIGRLLFRFYDVTSGAIRIDGQDIRRVAQSSLRGALGVVPQDTVLFNDTIYENIAYGRPSATPAEIERAARLARIHDFIVQSPDGYQTRVGERGLKLSGGEKQRVAIARAILKSPPILLFDEATSALDSATEKEIQEELRAMAEDRTTLVIAHRLSTIVDADEILVLDAGTIVERGRHPELLERGGLYAALWRKQRQESPGSGERTSAGSAALADGSFS